MSATCATAAGVVIRPGQLENVLESIDFVEFCTVVAGPAYGDKLFVILKIAECGALELQSCVGSTGSLQSSPSAANADPLDLAFEAHYAQKLAVPAQLKKLKQQLEAAVEAHQYQTAAELHAEISPLEEELGRSVASSNSTDFTLEPADMGVVRALTTAEEWSTISKLILSEQPGAISADAKDSVAVQLLTTPNNWTVENGMLSGELKKRRGILLAAYAGALDRISNGPGDYTVQQLRC